MTDYFKMNVGQNLKQQLQNDLELEYTAVKRLNDGIEVAVAVGDNGSRELMDKILHDEEHHIDWLEGQLHAIKEMTYENYLAQQLHKADEG
jgi:bacterioferritin